MGKEKQKNIIGMTQPSLKKTNIQKFSPMNFCFSSVLWKCTFNKKNHPNTPIEGISALFFRKNAYFALKGSMTVEAAIVLPLFMFFFLNLLWMMEIFNLQSTLQMALRECGSELCLYAYAYDRIVDEKEDTGLEAFVENITFSYLYVKEKVEEYAGVTYLEHSPAKGGKDGLIYADSSVLQEGDVIDLVISYQAEPFISIAGFHPGWFYARFYGRAWTGYDVSDRDNGKEEKYVYVTENASVYHWDRECSHIQLDIRKCGLEEAEALRNTDGDKYRPCELCITSNPDTVYITGDGNRYHSTAGCTGLRRTVYTMTLDRAAELYKECSRCKK